jgi:hypothetical protein
MRGCRFCGARLAHTFVDLGMSPLCESFLTADQLNEMEPFYPLHAYVCGDCFLVQVGDYVAPEAIFTEYAYFSSYSESWLAHARRYVEMATERFALGPQSQVVELGSNDGYLLQYFVERGVPSLGVEPSVNVGAAARARGVPTLTRMFGLDTARELAAQGVQADLIVGNNVLAQTPDLNGFVAGMQALVKPDGVITMEFPHLLRLMEGNQFDTIYHEHFSYFSLTTADSVFAAHGLAIVDVEELPTHGGSLRIYARRSDGAAAPPSPQVQALLAREREAGVRRLDRYAAFTEQVHETKRRLLEFLIGVKRAGRRAAGYGAPGKANTLLNYCGIREDFLDYTVDRNPYKHGKFTPGTRIPILPTERIRETRPDYVVILPWNLRDEIMAQLAYIRDWGGRFVVPIPDVKVYS